MAYTPGDWWMICERTGGKFLRSEMRQEWTGAWVHQSVWEPRHPQDSVKAVPDDPSVSPVFPDIKQAVGETTISHAVSKNGNAVYLNSTAGLTVNDPIGVVMDNGITHWTFIEGLMPDVNSQVLTGGNFSAVRKSDGTTWTWGRNDNQGQLGNNNMISKSSPVQVVGSHSFTSVSLGHFHGMGLKSDGSAWCWGYNTFGTLGDNIAASKSSPVSVVGSHSFVALVGGGGQSIALKSDGGAWCWGVNTSGECGDNSTTNRSSPVAVVGSHSFADLSGGRYHSMGLKADGTAWAWGAATYGQVGDNSTTSRSSPVAVVGSHSFTNISSGFNCSLGLKADGSIWTWGRNEKGQLGDNTTTNRSSPVVVVGSHSFTQIVIGKGSEVTVARKANGEVWCWGYNAYGQVGDNSTTNRSSPVQVVGSHSFTSISSGWFHVLAQKADGSIWAWGRNNYGQLGDLTTTNKSSPVLVLSRYAVVNDGLPFSGAASGNTVYLPSLNNEQWE